MSDQPKHINQDLEQQLAAIGMAATAKQSSADHRCGTIAIVGRPNVGKSTLLNSLIGQKVSITSRKAQTTRHRILGIKTQDLCQFVFIDTPGFQKLHDNVLNRTLNKTVVNAIGDVNLILFVVEAGVYIAPDQKVLELLGQDTSVILVVNKLDKIKDRSTFMAWLTNMQSLRNFDQIIPLSAKSPKDTVRLLSLCNPYLPNCPWLFDQEAVSDRSEKFLVSEMIREKLFRLTGDELPYTSAVAIDKFDEEAPKNKNQKRLLKIAASIIVERDSHKAMVVGAKGERIKRIGTEARVELETLLDAKVFLELWVKVRSGWSDNAVRIKNFGYE